MAKCPNCGATTNPEHDFCLSCGAEVEPDEPAIVPPAAVPPAAADAPEEPAAADPRPAPPPSPAPAGTGAGAPGRGSGAPSAGRARVEGGPPPARKADARSLIPLIAAILVSVALQQAIATVIPPDAYITRLFRPAGGWLMGVVPALIAFSLVWTLTDLVLKFRVSVVNERDINRPEIAHLPSYVAQGATEVPLQRIRSWDKAARSRPVARRVLWVMQHLETTEPQRAHELIRHQSDLEADTTAAGYRTVKLFIWAMPILGFIGTVLGISLAVGGFSEFLTTNVSIDEIDAVTAELGEVASGLSFAFDTTLLGLLGGLIASVVSSGVQAREERLLTRLEELGLRALETAAPGTVHQPAVAADMPLAGAEFDRMMRERLQELSRQMDHFTGAVRTHLDGFLEEWSKLPQEVERVGGDLGTLRGHLSAASQSSDRLVSETRNLLDGLTRASEGVAERINASVSSIDETTQALGDRLEGVTGALTTSMNGLMERLSASDERLRGAVQGLERAVERNHQESEAQFEAQVATEQALRALSESIAGLSTTLAEVRDAQSALTPLLTQLSGPLELRLVSPR